MYDGRFLDPQMGKAIHVPFPTLLDECSVSFLSPLAPCSGPIQRTVTLTTGRPL